MKNLYIFGTIFSISPIAMQTFLWKKGNLFKMLIKAFSITATHSLLIRVYTLSIFFTLRHDIYKQKKAQSN